MTCGPQTNFFTDLLSISSTELIFFNSPNNPTGHAATRKQSCFMEPERLQLKCHRSGNLLASQDYIKESDNLVSLHDQFRDCDRSRMETLLSGFQAEIDSISSDIRILQEKYMDMSLILKNRKLFGLVILCKLDEEGDDPSGEALDAETNNEKLEVSVQGYLQGYE
ncbi:uncharacterized protein LOC108343869 isoform X3 [Vigna angularis]|nr:uncharacterized protein LOC108343869 isoform X3 [Vigna angularis]